MKSRFLLFCLVSLLLSGCQDHYNFLEDVPQGQIIPDSARLKVKKGMSRQEVTTLLGSPVLNNINANRWEYIQYHRLHGQVTLLKTLIIHFDDQGVKAINFKKHASSQ